MLLKRVRSSWFFNVRGGLLAGTVVPLALIPEAIAFSIIAGVALKVGLYASFSGALPSSLPFIALPAVPLTLSTSSREAG